MLSYEPELEQLRPLLGDAATNTLIARERREVFSLYPELRILSWGGAMLLATAAGIVLKNNLDRIGPLALAIADGPRRGGLLRVRLVAPRPRQLVDDYVLLLGALLVSADVAFIESQFHLLGDAWQRHFLILAVVHGAARISSARAWCSRSRSPRSRPGWASSETSVRATPTASRIRAFVCAALLLRGAPRIDAAVATAARLRPDLRALRREHRLRRRVALMFEDDTRLVGCLFI